MEPTPEPYITRVINVHNHKATIIPRKLVDGPKPPEEFIYQAIVSNGRRPYDRRMVRWFKSFSEAEIFAIYTNV